MRDGKTVGVGICNAIMNTPCAFALHQLLGPFFKGTDKLARGVPGYTGPAVEDRARRASCPTGECPDCGALECIR
jgi:hypothetical protein